MCDNCFYMTPFERKLAKVQLFIVGAMVFGIAALAIISPFVWIVLLVAGVWQRFMS
jgi:hypothetical protein